MTEFFKQIVGLAGYGLVGIVIVMVIVLGYIAYKRPNNKFGILVLAGFCLIVISIFSFAGIGVVKENKVIEGKNDKLKEDSTQLSKANYNLSNHLKIADARLDITRFQNIALNDGELSKDSLTKIADNIAANLEVLSLRDTSVTRSEWASLAQDYKSISEKLKSDQFNSKQAMVEFKNNNNKILVAGKTSRLPVIEH